MKGKLIECEGGVEGSSAVIFGVASKSGSGDEDG
jgi:hypothetical protein